MADISSHGLQRVLSSYSLDGERGYDGLGPNRFSPTRPMLLGWGLSIVLTPARPPFFLCSLRRLLALMAFSLGPEKVSCD